jgi:putative ABC transport system permease protein
MVSLRFLARRKTVAAIAIITMALALGANTAALSILNAVLFSSLGIPDADRLLVVMPERNMPGRGTVVFNDAYPNYQLLRGTQRSFAEAATFLTAPGSWEEGGDLRSVSITRATASFFNTVRVQPKIGRPFAAEEEGPGPKTVAVISHALWTSSMASDVAAIGRTVAINGEPHTIIGVMPDGFAQPASTDVWLPFDIPAAQRTGITGARTLTNLARLRDDVTLDDAKRDVASFSQRAIDAAPAENKDYRYNVNTLRSTLLNGADETATFVQVGAATLLLLAILNLASLLVAWGFERRQELTVRLALGAGGQHVTKLLLEQSLIIVAIGGALGLFLAKITLLALQRFDFGPFVTELVGRATLDAPTLLGSVIAAMVTGLAAGAMPAWFARGANLSDALRASSRGATLSPGALRWQRAMVFGQAALSIVILAATALIAVSYWKLSRVPDGFDPKDRVIARLTLPDGRFGKHPARAAFAASLLDNLSREPDIAGAGFSNTVPVGDVPWGGRFFIPEADGALPKEPALLHIRRVSWTYLATMSIPLLQGRMFTVHDDSTAPLAAIISKAVAAKYWPNTSPVGKTILRNVPGSPPVATTIVGVVGNTMDAGYGAPAGEAVYLPYAQVSVTRLTIVAKTRGAPQATIAAVKRALRATDASAAASGTATLESLVMQANALPRLRALVLLLFALVAVGIVALGSYGVMRQLVGNRERELAVRLVFGAEPRQLGLAVLVEAATLTIPGIAVGLAITWLLGGMLQTFVFGVEPRSLIVFGGVGVGVLVLASLATLPSAVRAMRVDIRRGIGGS